MRGGKKCRSGEKDKTEGWVTEKLRRKEEWEDKMRKGRNEDQERKGI